jgi:oligo-1,6-glucosidase
MYGQIKNKGGDLKEFIESQKISARDNGRTPFQWDAGTNAGFTTGTPWIKINSNYTTVNVAVQEKDSNSCLNYFRKIVQLRKANPVLTYGKYTLLDKDNPNVYAYTRELDGVKFMVLLNFSKNNVDFNFNEYKSSNKTLLISNYANAEKAGGPMVKLQPYQAVVYKIN